MYVHEFNNSAGNLRDFEIGVQRYPSNPNCQLPLVSAHSFMMFFKSLDCSLHWVRTVMISTRKCQCDIKIFHKINNHVSGIIRASVTAQFFQDTKSLTIESIFEMVSLAV